ncbi:exonuclease VII large subunit [Methylorubrum sp. Q1]|uniref:exodeoxyribonuclease VII large subunit n=1 Tax=Methylorubrum sp. Q1 TaxID=2562453 RepID=UPI001075E42E|nr:exodeoxyribonuclease VII large subunit [Methylorubrum sp. Q1]TFZ55594.1 exonuclease VII large subunit [Methylorubrum sp. Q1]
MRHHRFHHGPDAPSRPPHPASLPDGARRSLPDTGDAVHSEAAVVGELRDLIGWLRQRLRGEHTVRASVLNVEPNGQDSHLILLGEADARLTNDPPRLKARLDAAELAQIRAEHGPDFDPESLVNRTVTLSLRTNLRQRFGRGAGVQAKVMGLLSVGQVPLEADLDRESTLQRLRLAGRRFGPETWSEPEDPCHIALVVSEHGEVRRDVEHVLQPLEDAGLIRIHRVWAIFEGAGAERSLAEAFAGVAGLQREHGVSATLVCRGGGPVEAFRPLNAFGTANAAARAEVPNLIAGLGHAGTPRTALDAVAARSEPTPTAAAMRVRQLVERTGARAERALAGLDAAIEAELEAAGRIVLARAGAAFDRALRDLADRADDRLRQLSQGVEQSLLANLAAATGVSAKSASGANPAGTDPLDQAALLDETGEDDLLSDALTLVIAAETGQVVTTAEQASAAAELLLHFTDGVVPARVEPRNTAIPSATTH